MIREWDELSAWLTVFALSRPKMNSAVRHHGLELPSLQQPASMKAALTLRLILIGLPIYFVWAHRNATKLAAAR